MFRIIALAVLIASVLVGYLMYKIWINHKRKRQVDIAIGKSQNSSNRRRSKKRKKRRKSSRVKKRRKNKKKRKTSIHPKSIDEHTHPPVVTMQPIPQTFKPINLKTDHPAKSIKDSSSFYQIDENHLNKGFVPIARRRSKPTTIDNKKSPCLCMNCNDPSSNINQMRNNVDFTKYVLSCDENDTANISNQTNPVQQRKSCEVCIVNSICTDDAIYFGISISKTCHKPLKTYFSYQTDINSKHLYYNTTFTCVNCNVSISIDSISDAWDYTLRLESPKPLKTCPTQHTAHCGGAMSQIMWFITGSLSGLFILFGFLLCIIKHCCIRKKPIKKKNESIEVAVINA